MLLSVIIPTCNRSKILEKTLEAVFQQSLAHKNYEVIVVDDGSQDNTKKAAENYMKKQKNLNYFYQKNQGQGIARNTGVELAKGNIIIFIGDDIFVTPDFLHEHLRYHLYHPEEHEAVLGFTEWDPQLTITPLMKWLTNGSAVFGKFGGHQFAYEKLEGKQEANYNFFYTCNISLKKSLLEKFPFDPSFSKYGWEDIELGYRLYKRVGLKLYYNPKAIGYHHHFMDEENLKNRMLNIGKSAWIIHRKYPELKKIPSQFKQFIFWLIANTLSLGVLSMIKKISRGKIVTLYYYALSKKYFLEGLQKNI